ncbi:DUF4221 family protein [uncultured Chitinophaga sp.]|uniref:DUF4221 family protein n=1 Tax=uncultured Chitinophaga sp. TaxID=339340 RepID=UPI0025FB7CB5|nr:DUF4221 family protein [uncultured Chitinophaga sp.]
MPISYRNYIAYLLLICFFACRPKTQTGTSNYVYLPPDYSQESILLTNDTIHFLLDSNTYNKITSQNIFYSKNTAYMAIYDELSESLNIYSFTSQTLKKRLVVKDLLPTKQKRKINAYVVNFDSILVINNKTLYLMDSSGHIKSSIKAPKTMPDAWVDIENTTPPLIKNGHIYTTISPFVKQTSFEDLTKWKVICDFDLKSKKVNLLYNLPEIYHQNLYGYHFLEYSHCINTKGNLVFSFPADTTIYETDLNQLNNAYYGKSRFQTRQIAPVDRDSIEKFDVGFKEYLRRDSYSSIYYDAYHHRYLRIVRSGMDPQLYINETPRSQRLIIFNEQFKIVGESPIDASVKLKMLFVGPDGHLYARVKTRDETAINYIKMSYQTSETARANVKTTVP